MRYILFILLLLDLTCEAQVTAHPTLAASRVYPLDVAQAQLAVSYFKLRSAYTGACVRIRRAGDNVEQDFGFVNGHFVDTAAIRAFLTTNDGFVVTRYDQSGNGFNLSQTTAANQPQIYIGSTQSFYRSDNFFSEYYNTAGSFKSLTLGSTGLGRAVNQLGYLAIARPEFDSTIMTIFAISTSTANSVRFASSFLGGASKVINMAARRLDTETNATILASGNNVFAKNNNYLLIGVINYNNTTASINNNGSQIAATSTFSTIGSTSATNATASLIGGSFGNTNRFFGYLPCVVIYHQSIDRPTIELLFNNLYSIY